LLSFFFSPWFVFYSGLG